MLKSTSTLCRLSTTFTQSAPRSAFNGVPAKMQIREHSVKKKNNMGRFFPETYINGSRILPYWLDHRQGNRSKKLDMSNLNDQRQETPAFPSVPKDESATVTITAPKGYIADRIAANESKSLHYFQKRSGDTTSAIAVSFSSEHADASMERLVQMSKMAFWASNPFGHVSSVKIGNSAIAHLKKSKVELECVLFDPHGIEPRVGQLTCLLKTPGGLWKITWHTTMETLFDDTDFFATVLKNVKVVLNNRPSKNSVDIATEVASPSQQETTDVINTVGQPLAPIPQASVAAHGLDSEAPSSTDSS